MQISMLISGMCRVLTGLLKASLPECRNEKWYEEELKADEHAEKFYSWIEDLYKEKIDFFRKVAEFNFEPEVSAEERKELFTQMILDLERQVLLKVNDNLLEGSSAVNGSST